MNDPLNSDFRPTAPWRNLRLRADLLQRVRAFFLDRGFLEVETPLLSADTVVDRHIDPISVTLPESNDRMWLQTSPEFGMKRLLAAGGEEMPNAIYQITRAFRSSESGSLHNPEFTIVEWYRSGHSMNDGIQLLSDLCDALLGRGQAERISYRDAFLRHAEFDPFTIDTAEFPCLATACGLAVPPEMPDDRDPWLDLFLADQVGPKLGIKRPAILYDYPASQAMLAKVRAETPPVAERFELFVDGVELANGYHELTDADQLRRRITEANALRRADGKRPLPEESRLLSALDDGLPACTGCALGFDRVVMLAAGAKSLAEVVAFPIDRA